MHVTDLYLSLTAVAGCSGLFGFILGIQNKSLAVESAKAETDRAKRHGELVVSVVDCEVFCNKSQTFKPIE
jgi:hypothetical protein